MSPAGDVDLLRFQARCTAQPGAGVLGPGEPAQGSVHQGGGHEKRGRENLCLPLLQLGGHAELHGGLVVGAALMAEDVVPDLMGAGVALKGLGVAAVQDNSGHSRLAEVEPVGAVEWLRGQPEFQTLGDHEHIDRSVVAGVHVLVKASGGHAGRCEGVVAGRHHDTTRV